MNDRDTGEVQLGTAGWDSEDSVEDTGDGVGSYTSVRVTLFRGRDLNRADPSPEVAKGEKITAMLPGQQVPKQNTLCWCIRAAGTSAWMLAANQVKNTTDQFKGAERALLDFGDDVDVVIRAKSVSIQSADGHFIAVGPRTGIQASDPRGSGLRLVNDKWMMWVADDSDSKSILQLTKTNVQIAQKGGSGKSSSTWSGAHMNNVGTGQFTARFPNGALGCFPSVLTPTLVPLAVFSAPTPSIPIYSTSWFGPGP